MKLEIRNVLGALVLFTSLSLASSAHADNTSYLKSLFKRLSPARSGIASELSPQHKDITSRLIGQGLMRTVKVHNDFIGFLNLSDFMDPVTAEKISELIEFSINGYAIKKKNASGYTIIPVRQDQPIKIEIALNRGNATLLLEIIKSKVALPSWTDSSLMQLLNLMSFRITYERPLDRENNEYFLSNFICEQEDLANFISEPAPDALMGLVKKHGSPGWFDINIDLPRIKPIEFEQSTESEEIQEA